MPPPPRHRAPHLLPIQNHHRLPPPPTSNPSSATTSNNPYQAFLNTNVTNTGYANPNSPSDNPQQHLLSPYDNSIDGNLSTASINQQPGSVRRARLEAEARQQQEYRLLNEDGDSIIDFYNHTTGDERAGGGISSANLSPIDFPHGGASGQHHNLLWLHHQQRLQQQLAAQRERELQENLNQEFYQQDKEQEEVRLHTSKGVPPPSNLSGGTLSSATLGGSNIRNLEEDLQALEKDIRALKLGSRENSVDSGIVERVIGTPPDLLYIYSRSSGQMLITLFKTEQPYYPPVPKLTSSPTHFSYPSAITSKIPSHAPSPIISSPYLPPPSATLYHSQQLQQYQQEQGQCYQDEQYSSSQAEEEQEEQQSRSSTESEASSSEQEDEDMSTSSTPPSWIASFCSLQGHEYFAEVSEDFIEDDFNLTGLNTLVPMYKESLEMILDVEPDDEDEENSEDEADEDDSQLGGGHQSRSRKEKQFHSATDMESLEQQAELLYGLIHQRFITSRAGMQIMYEKYQNNHFGFCPRVYCNSTKVLPCGYSDTPGVETVKLYCPSCMDVYVPPNSRFQTVDGAFFGTTFPPLFFLTFPDLEVSASASIPPSISGAPGSSGSGAPPGYKPSPSQLKKQKEERGEMRTINGVLECNIAPGLGKSKSYEMKIYGFKVSERAKGGPRMKWLRSRPDDLSVLDEGKRWAEMQKEQNRLIEDVEGEDGDDDSVMGEGGMVGVAGTTAALRGGENKGRQVLRKPVKRSAKKK